MPSVRNGNIDIHYEVTGQGMPFLFFSETACPGDIWNNFQVPEFSRDHRVITHDYRGTGQIKQADDTVFVRRLCR